MQLLLILVGPIVWGVAGLFRGRMPISSYRELRPPHLARFAWTLILLPVVFCALAASAFAIATLHFNYPTKDAFLFLMFSIFALMLFLAIALAKAKKYSVPVHSYVTETKIEIPVDSDVKSGPDFSNIDD